MSACDANVGKALFFECIINKLRADNKSIILATHQIQYIPYADKVLVIDNDGNQTFFGTYKELLIREKEFKNLQLNNIVVENKEDIIDMFTTKYDGDNDKKVRNNKAIAIISAEDRNQGNISFDLCMKYLNSGGLLQGVMAISSSLLGCHLTIILFNF